jgi:cyclophilin family peptidyl-prolyl cis-trans isomerase/HEAT repeat protein
MISPGGFTMRRPYISFISLMMLMLLVSTVATPGQGMAAGRYDRLILSAAGKAKLADLAAMEDSRKSAGIEKYVADPDPLIRLRSAEVLGRVGGADAVPHLVRLTRDTDEEVVLSAIYSLGLTLDESALAPLSTILSEGNKKQKTAALEALGITRLKDAAPAIGSMTTNFHSSIRAQALTSLAVLGDSAAAGMCVNSLHDPDPDVVEAAVYALGRLGYDRMNLEIIGLLEHENLWVVMRSCEALGRLKADDAVEPLALMLSHEQRMIGIKAAEALWRIGNGSAAEALQAVLGSEDAYFRRLALNGIAASRRGKSFDFVLPLLEDGSQMVRRAAMEAAAATDSDKARPFLLEIVREGNPYDRAAALEFLGLIGKKEDIKLLVETLDGSVNHLEREGAAAGLSLFGDDDHLRLQVGSSGRTAFDALLDAADGDDPVIAAMAVEALHGKRAVGGTDRLIAAFRGHNGREDSDRKLAIITVFNGLAGEGDVEEPEANNIAALLKEAAVTEGDPRVAEAAEAAARRYGIDISIEKQAVTWDRGVYPWGDPALPMGKRIIRLTTSRGPVEIELFGDDAPNIVKSVLTLAEEGFYNGLNFHRVVPGFVVQGGCPRGDGWGDAGWFLRSQFNRHRYERGYVGMAHAGKDTPGSQIFITHLPQPHLDGRYTIIGKVTKGMSVVDRLEVGDTFGMEIVQ